MNRWLKVLILFYLSCLFFGSFAAVGVLWTLSDQSFHYIHELKNFLYYFFAGAIGGSLYYLYQFCSHYTKNKLDDYRQWIKYIFYPIFATGTAVITITLIQSGILMIDFTNTGNTLYAQVSIAFFVGFGFHNVMKKLMEISNKLFESDDNKNIEDKSKKDG